MKNFVIGLLVVLLLAAFSTNPGYNDFEHRIRAEVRQSVGASEGVSGAAVDLVIDAVGLGRFIGYKDYKFFSFYTVSYPGFEPDNFIGAFGGFRQVYLKGGKKLVD